MVLDGVGWLDAFPDSPRLLSRARAMARVTISRSVGSWLSSCDEQAAAGARSATASDSASRRRRPRGAARRRQLLGAITGRSLPSDRLCNLDATRCTGLRGRAALG